MQQPTMKNQMRSAAPFLAESCATEVEPYEDRLDT